MGDATVTLKLRISAFVDHKKLHEPNRSWSFLFIPDRQQVERRFLLPVRHPACIGLRYHP